MVLWFYSIVNLLWGRAMDIWSKQTLMGRTSIQVSEELADELYSMKSRGETYEDVIWRLVENYRE